MIRAVAETLHADLLARLAERVREDGLTPPPPVPDAAVQRAEAELGFALPPLLAAAYRTVGDGGFGPEYHLLSLLDGPTDEHVVALYTANRSEFAGTDWAWPEGVLPIMTRGCGMYACVDCRSDDGTVLLFEPNPGDPDQAWYVDSPSLAEWFERHLADTGWWADDESDQELVPWTGAPARR